MVAVYVCIILAATVIGAICGMGGGVIIKPLLDAVSSYSTFQIGIISGACVLAMSVSSLIKHIASKTPFKAKTVLLLSAGSVAGGLLGDLFMGLIRGALGSGAGVRSSRLGFGREGAERERSAEERTIAAVKGALRPELIGRIDEIVVFRPLSSEDIARIADNMLAGLIKRAAERGIDLEITPRGRALVARLGADGGYGARELRRVIRRGIEDRLGEMMLSGEAAFGDRVIVDDEGGRIVLAVG